MDKLTPEDVRAKWIMKALIALIPPREMYSEIKKGLSAEIASIEEAARREAEQKPRAIACPQDGALCETERCLEQGSCASPPAKREGLGSAAAFKHCDGCITRETCAKVGACPFPDKPAMQCAKCGPQGCDGATAKMERAELDEARSIIEAMVAHQRKREGDIKAGKETGMPLHPRAVPILERCIKFVEAHEAKAVRRG